MCVRVCMQVTKGLFVRKDKSVEESSELQSTGHFPTSPLSVYLFWIRDNLSFSPSPLPHSPFPLCPPITPASPVPRPLSPPSSLSPSITLSPSPFCSAISFFSRSLFSILASNHQSPPCCLPSTPSPPPHFFILLITPCPYVDTQQKVLKEILFAFGQILLNLVGKLISKGSF